MESRFPFSCAPQIAGLRPELEKRRPQHFADSWWASRESKRHSASGNEKAPHQVGQSL